jgi:hypothetical protein
MSEVRTTGHLVSTGSAARWLIVILLSAIATCLALEVGLGTSSARAQVTMSGGKDVMVVGGQITKDSYGLYLVDLKNQTICVYQWLPATRKLRLMAARTFSYDVQLDDFNADRPTPGEVKYMVEQNLRLKNVKDVPASH